MQFGAPEKETAEAPRAPDVRNAEAVALTRRDDATEFDCEEPLADTARTWKEGDALRTPLSRARMARLEDASWFAPVRARWEAGWATSAPAA
jgi:hypothetical protein